LKAKVQILNWLSPKAIGFVIIIGLLLAGIYKIHHEGYKAGLVERDKVQSVFDKFKSDQSDDAAKQAGISFEKERVQNETTAKSKLDYAQAVKERNAAIARLGDFRLCPIENLPRGKDLPVAESAIDPVRKETTSPKRTDETASLATTFKFSDAIRDRDQCNGLIAWVCSQGMCSP
jgi:hypothetical protein